MFATSAVILAFAAQALAGPFITAPIASTVFSGGKTNTITWIDNGQAPTLANFGPSRVSIYVGNAQQQTPLQLIAPSVDVSKNNSIEFTVDPTIGPDGTEYFIRVESLSLKDAAAPQYPALAFSAKFRLDHMTGTFTPAILAQIAGQSTAPLAGQTSTPAAARTTPTTTPAKTTPTPTGSGTAANSTDADDNGAVSARAGWAAIVVGAVVAGAVLF